MFHLDNRELRRRTRRKRAADRQRVDARELGDVSLAVMRDDMIDTHVCDEYDHAIAIGRIKVAA
jgi:hypothetical protein